MAAAFLLFLHGDRHTEESWLLPYPPNPSKPPRQVMFGLPSYGGSPTFDWMPDSRHVLLALRTSPESPSQMWMADISSSTRYAVTSGTGSPSGVAVSPDGRKLVFTEFNGHYDIVSVDLEHGSAERMISTDHDELMPAWAGKQQALVYVTDRNGPQEIWLHTPDRADRPLVTSRDFPPETTQWFMGPALAPDAGRVVYSRMERHGGGRAWISSVSGGAPVPLTNDAAATEFPGSWSPDGSWFVYLAIRDGAMNLFKVKVSGQATPVLVKANSPCETPSWSPAGDWILCGKNLISPDGQTVKPLGDHKTQNFAFSPSGKLLYGIREEGDSISLFSLDIATGTEKPIASLAHEFRPGSNLHPAVRFSVAPDGKSFAYGAGQFKTDLWMLEGFASKSGLLARFGLR